MAISNFPPSPLHLLQSSFMIILKAKLLLLEELKWSYSEMQVKTSMLFWSYKTLFELFFPVLEEISFESLTWLWICPERGERLHVLQCLRVLCQIFRQCSVAVPINTYLFRIW